MEFPLNSLGAFGAAFGITSLLCDWLRTYVFGWYETKWSPGFNFGIDLVATLLFLVPLAMFGFSVGAYVVTTEQDPWGRSLVGGVLLATVFFGVTRLALQIDSAVLVNALVWSTLLLGSGGAGVWARLSARRVET